MRAAAVEERLGLVLCGFERHRIVIGKTAGMREHARNIQRVAKNQLGIGIAAHERYR